MIKKKISQKAIPPMYQLLSNVGRYSWTFYHVFCTRCTTPLHVLNKPACYWMTNVGIIASIIIIN